MFFRKSRSPTNKGRTVVVNNTTNPRSPSISPSRKHSISPHEGRTVDHRMIKSIITLLLVNEYKT